MKGDFSYSNKQKETYIMTLKNKMIGVVLLWFSIPSYSCEHRFSIGRTINGEVKSFFWKIVNFGIERSNCLEIEIMKLFRMDG